MTIRRYVKAQQHRTNYLRAWREAAGFTQAQVEERYGWKQGKISTLERNMAIITPEIQEKLAQVYFCKPEDLLHPPPASRVTAGFGVESDDREGITALADTLVLLRKVRSEMRIIRQRLDVLEPQLDTAVEATAKAVRTQTELASLFERGASTLKRTIHQALEASPTPTPTVKLSSNNSDN